MAGPVGMVGVGAMGSAIASRLLQAGYEVVGTDPREECVALLENRGGHGVRTALEVAEAAPVVILSLPSAEAFLAVTTGPDGVGEVSRADIVVIDTCTLDIDDKLIGREHLASRGIELLDCTLSGTPPMCLENEMTLYGSGDQDVYDAVTPVIASFTRDHTYLGEFGNASRMKYVINFLVLIHNAATAEALTLGEKLGLDPALVHSMVADSFGASRVWERRGKLMLAGDYRSSRNTYSIARKDGSLITTYAARAHVPVPVFAAALQMHQAGLGQGLGQLDPASIYEIYRRNAGLRSQLRSLEAD